MVENSFNSVCSSAKRLARTRSSSRHDHDLVEKCVHRLSGRRENRQGLLIFLLLPVCFHSGSVGLNVCREPLLFIGGIRQGLELCGRLEAGFLRLLQDVAHAFAGRRDGLEFGQMQNALQRLRPCHRIHHIIRIRRQHRAYHVVVEAQGVAQDKTPGARAGNGLPCRCSQRRRRTSSRRPNRGRLRAHP